MFNILSYLIKFIINMFMDILNVLYKLFKLAIA